MGKFYKFTVIWFRLQLTHQTTEPVKPSIMMYNSNAKSNAAFTLLHVVTWKSN